MDWIKINTALPRSPKVRRLASLMGVDKHTALGLVLDWLCWVDSATADGCTGLTVDEINAEFACNANTVTACNASSVTPCNAQVLQYCNAMLEIGWAELDENGIVHVHNFEAHNGENAKRRAQGAKRVAVMRKRVCNANSVTPCNATSVTREEKRREDKKIDSKESTKKPQKGGNVPLPETSDEVLTYIAAQPNCGLTGDELTACVETFFNQSEAVGWTLNGQPVRDWRASARAFLAKWQNNIASRAAAAPRTGKITYRSETQQNYDL